MTEPNGIICTLKYHIQEVEDEMKDLFDDLPTPDINKLPEENIEEHFDSVPDKDKFIMFMQYFKLCESALQSEIFFKGDRKIRYLKELNKEMELWVREMVMINPKYNEKNDGSPRPLKKPKNESVLNYINHADGESLVNYSCSESEEHENDVGEIKNNESEEY